MELMAYWKAIRRRWWLVLAPLLVVLAYTVATYHRPPTVYQVVMRFAAGSQPAGLSEDYDRYYPWLTSEYVANGLADVVGSGAFAQAVVARLAAQGVTMDVAAVQGGLVADNAQSILVVYLTWPDPEQAITIAQALADELTLNGAAYFPQLEGLDPALTLLDSPQPQPLPPGLRAQLLGPAVRLALALAAGIGLALLWHYLDPTVYEATELEEAGLRVLAQIPRK